MAARFFYFVIARNGVTKQSQEDEIAASAKGGLAMTLRLTFFSK